MRKTLVTALSGLLVAASAAAASPLYDVRGIFDPGFGGIVAYAIKVPHDWQMQQAFTRTWDGALPNNEIFLNVSTPDGREAITVLPEMRFRWPTGPNGDVLKAMAQRSGDASVRAPMAPVAFLKQVLLPRLARQAGSPPLRLSGEHEDAPQTTRPQMQQAIGWVEGELPNGRKVRVTASVVTRAVAFGQGNGLYVWSVISNVVETEGDLAPVVAEARTMMDSLAPNPDWKRQDDALKARGNAITDARAAAELKRFQAAQAQTMAQFRQNVANQHARGETLRQTAQRRSDASHQAASAYADYMGDKTLYQNPSTGERVKVQGSLGNVYQDTQGGVLNSSQPLSGNHVDWQRLQQVEMKNY